MGFVLAPWFWLVLAGVFGLCMGSFFNVVIYRLPRMLRQEWRAECQAFLAETADKETADSVSSLCQPRSYCPHCYTPISPLANIPVLSYLCLRGRCAQCQRAISWRYPLVELTAAALAIVAVAYLGVQWQTVAAIVFSWALLVLLAIDTDHQLLPDNITLPMLWLGLLANTFSLFASLQEAVLGAVSGYLVFWTIATLFRYWRGKEGMGHGDFKLLAMIGAWLGWQSLPLVILFASCLGTLGSITILWVKRYHRATPLPFGPYLAIAGWVVMFWGHAIFRWYGGQFIT